MFRTPLGRLVSKESDALRDRMLRVLYDIATSPANDGKIGARLDTIYLGMAGLGYAQTRRLLARLIDQRLVERTFRNEYRLTPRGLTWIRNHASEAALSGGSY